MKKIFKFELSNQRITNGIVTVDTPEDFIPLSAQDQNGHLVVWALVDPVSRLSERSFVIAMTGERLTEKKLQFIGTIQLDGGLFVLHVLMVIP